MQKPVIGLLSGSIRKASINTKLLAAMAILFEQADMETRFLNLADYDMPIYNEDLENEHGIPETTRKLAEDMRACAGILVATPEYNGSLPPLLKNVIDWTSRTGLEHFKSPVYGIAATTPGPLSGIMALRELHFILSRLGARIVPTTLGAGNASELFDEAGRWHDGRTKTLAEQLVREMKAALGYV